MVFITTSVTLAGVIGFAWRFLFRRCPVIILLLPLGLPFFHTFGIPVDEMGDYPITPALQPVSSVPVFRVAHGRRVQHKHIHIPTPHRHPVAGRAGKHPVRRLRVRAHPGHLLLLLGCQCCVLGLPVPVVAHPLQRGLVVGRQEVAPGRVVGHRVEARPLGLPLLPVHFECPLHSPAAGTNGRI